MHCLHVFSRAWRRLHVFASNSDWFIAPFTSVEIGQNNYFGFGFTTLDRKPLDKSDTYTPPVYIPEVFFDDVVKRLHLLRIV